MVAEGGQPAQTGSVAQQSQDARLRRLQELDQAKSSTARELEVTARWLQQYKKDPEKNAKQIAGYEQRLKDLQAQNRSSIAEELVLKATDAAVNAADPPISGMNERQLRDRQSKIDDARDGAIQQYARDAQDRLYAAHEVFKQDYQQAQDSDKRDQIKAQYEQTVGGLHAQIEMANEAQRNLYPRPLWDMNQSLNVTEPANKRYLEDLMKRIVNDYVEDPSKEQADTEAQIAARTIERDADVNEYVRIARNGLFADENLAPIGGQERQFIAANAIRQLMECLRAHGVDPGTVTMLMTYLTSLGARSAADGRLAVANRLDQLLDNDEAYRRLRYLSPGQEQSKPVFLAMARLVRAEAERVEDWRANLTAGYGDSSLKGLTNDPGAWFMENFSTKRKIGLGTALRIGDSTGGKDDLTKVDARIRSFERESDAVIDAFTRAAATDDPAALSASAGKEDQRAFDLLKAHGYITQGSDGRYSYAFPNGSYVTNLKQRAGIPGATLLDLISADSVMKTAAITLAPELVGARIGAAVEGASALVRSGALVGRIGAEAIIGNEIDAAWRTAEGEHVDFQRMAVDTAVMLPVGMVTRGVTEKLSSTLAKQLNSRAAREGAFAILNEAIGIPSESALQTIYSQAYRRAGDPEHFSDEFLATMVNNAMTRAIANGNSSINRIREGKGVLPTGLKDYLDANGQTIQRDAEKLRYTEEQAARKFDAIAGDNPRSPQAIEAVDSALRLGKLDFSDLRSLYRRDPEKYGPVANAIVQRREGLVDQVFDKARQRSAGVIDRAFDAEAAAVREFYANAPGKAAERDAQLADIQRRRKVELDLADKDAVNLGSRKPTSDLDQNIKSTYVRDEARRLMDFALRGGDLATMRAPEGGLAPGVPSAQALDVNHYVDVIPVIKAVRDVPGIDQTTVRIDGMSHADHVQANALATEMELMNATQRQQFIDQKLRLTPDAGKPAMQKRLDFAKASLNDSEHALTMQLGDMNIDPNDASPADILRAQDALYAKRTAEIRPDVVELQRQLDVLREGRNAKSRGERITPEMQTTLDAAQQKAAVLSSKIERAFNVTNRDYIEAYTDFAGLNDIVAFGQGGTPKRSARDLIAALDSTDPAVRDPARKAMRISASDNNPQDGATLISDQARFLIEHMDHYKDGSEGTLDTANALVKYGERVLLGLRIKDGDLGSGPSADLFRQSGLLEKARSDNPKAFADALRTLGGGDPDVGLQRYASLLEAAAPELTGILTSDRPSWPSDRARRLALAALQRDREQNRAATAATYGPDIANDVASDELAQMRQELRQLETMDAERNRLASTYLPQNWALAQQKEAEAAANHRVAEALPDCDKYTPGSTDVLLGYEPAEKDLELMRRAFDNAGKPSLPPGVQKDFDRRAKRIAALRDQIPARAQELDRARSAGGRATLDTLRALADDGSGVPGANGGNTRVPTSGTGDGTPSTPLIPLPNQVGRGGTAPSTNTGNTGNKFPDPTTTPAQPQPGGAPDTSTVQQHLPRGDEAYAGLVQRAWADYLASGGKSALDVRDPNAFGLPSRPAGYWKGVYIKGGGDRVVFFGKNGEVLYRNPNAVISLK
jgi:hypothetical protein